MRKISISIRGIPGHNLTVFLQIRLIFTIKYSNIKESIKQEKNKRQELIKVSQIELLLLGMLIEGPKSAYDIQKDIEYHELSRWTKIGVASVYKKVLRLCEQGHLQGCSVQGKRRGHKVVYEITDRGRAYFEQLMQIYARRSVTFCLEMNLVVANLNKLEPKKALAMLGQLYETIAQSARQHDGYITEYAGEPLPLPARAILEQQKEFYDTLLKWMGTFSFQFREEAARHAELYPDHSV